MATRKQVMQDLVKKEAKNLKKFATAEELKMLNITDLNSTSMYNCVYGQITGSCNSDRAVELIEKCCKRVYNSSKVIKTKHGTNNIANSPLNGSPKKNDRVSYWSPIEVFISNNSKKDEDEDIDGYTAAYDENNKRLVKYLKGETNRLTFVK